MRSTPRPRHRRSPEEIEQILGRFRASGLSQNRFAQLHAIHPVTLGYWIRRAEHRSAGVAPPSLVRVRIKEADATSLPAFEVLLRSRRVLRIAGDFDADALRRIVAILDEGC